MQEIVGRDETITRHVWDRAEAVAHFEQAGERFKAEWIGELPENEDISVYTQGDWLDLCTGPHLPSTGRLPKAFKLMKVAGAYWRGDPNNPQLQRIYGTAWRDQKELKAYLTRLEEARSATIAASAARWTCFTSSRKPSAAFSGTPRAGPSIAPPSATCARGWSAPAMWRSRRPVDRPRPVGALRPLGEVPRAHVRRRGG